MRRSRVILSRRVSLKPSWGPMTTFSFRGVEMLRRRKKRMSTHTAPAMPSTRITALPFTSPCTSASKSVTKETSPTGKARITACSRGRAAGTSATARAGSSTKRCKNSPEHMPSTKKTAASRLNRRSNRRTMSVFTSRWSSASSRSRLWARVLVMGSAMDAPPAPGSGKSPVCRQENAGPPLRGHGAGRSDAVPRARAGERKRSPAHRPGYQRDL